MTREDEIRAREQAATPGDWTTVDLSEFTDKNKPYTWVWEADMPYGNGSIAEVLTDGLPGEEGVQRTRANAEFIAHSRQDIPYLLERNEFLTDKILEIAKLANHIHDVDVWTADESEYGRHLFSLLDRIDDVILDSFTNEELA